MRPVSRTGNKMTVKIEVDIVVPPEFVPPPDNDFDKWEQFLTLNLADYFPRLIEECRDKVPYLDDLDFMFDNVSASYREAEVYAKGGYSITIHIKGTPEPEQLVAVNLRSELQLALLNWFRSKDLSAVRLAPLGIEWHDS